MTGISKNNGDLPGWEVSVFCRCEFGSILRLIADEYAEGFLRSVLLPLRAGVSVEGHGKGMPVDHLDRQPLTAPVQDEILGGVSLGQMQGDGDLLVGHAGL